MGQYFKPVFVDRDGNISVLHPSNFDNGLKIGEHFYVGNMLVNAALCFIKPEPTRLAWIGDYSINPYEGLYSTALAYDEFMQCYEAAWSANQQTPVPAAYFSENVLKDICTLDTVQMFIINHSKREYIELHDYIKQNSYTEKGAYENGVYNESATLTWCIHPLPLLTACGNGRGGGDYDENCTGYDDVGKWAFDLLEYSSVKPKDFAPVMFRFKDREAD